MLATALLHCIGMAFGLVIRRMDGNDGWRIAQTAGGAMALAGLALLAGVA